MYIGHLAEVPGSNPATAAWGRENRGQSRLRSFVASLGTVPGFRSTRALFDQNKAQVAHYEYTPYGELYASSGTASTTHMFTGHDWDATAGHYFAPYRYYRPDLARWLSPDPAGFVAGTNAYLYTQNNPVVFYDKFGLVESTLIGGVPYCACKSKQAADEARANFPHVEGSRRYGNRRWGDHMRHCTWNCNTTKDAGRLCAWATSTAYEIWPRAYPADEWDYVSNESGRDCGSAGEDCFTCCNRKFLERNDREP